MCKQCYISTSCNRVVKSHFERCSKKLSNYVLMDLTLCIMLTVKLDKKAVYLSKILPNQKLLNSRHNIITIFLILCWSLFRCQNSSAAPFRHIFIRIILNQGIRATIARPLDQTTCSPRASVDFGCP